MGKKQAQFRFEEEFYDQVSKLAQQEGMTISEIVRNAIKLYIALYERTKEDKMKLFLVSGKNNDSNCEVILPWLT